jgi:site-specific DNA recombinase
MTTMPSRAAIYARISSDTEGTRAGVDRQLADCHTLAESLGWNVAQEYVDNDISAYSGKRRPEYQRMLADLADGLVDAIIVYNIDRLTRRPAELEHFYEAVTAAKVSQVRFVTGDTDISTVDGLMMARILGAFAAKESANIGRRVSRKMEQVAAEGRPHGGPVRPFGYADDKITVLPGEATTFRLLSDRFLAGESTRSLATWLNDQEIPTVTGRPWITTTVKGMLTNPRYAGLRSHKGLIVGPAVWDAIITEDQHRRILAKYAEAKNSGRRIPQRYLLSGMLRCGKCGTRLYSSARVNTRRYVCMSGPDHGGCGRLTITADPLERLIADAVLYRLDTPELADALAGRSSTDERITDLSSSLQTVQERLDDLPAAFAAGEISRRDWALARKPLEEQRDHLQRQLGRLTHTSALAGLIGNGQELGRTWSDLTLSRQHAIVKAIIDHIDIAHGNPGVTALDPARVSVIWRH